MPRPDGRVARTGGDTVRVHALGDDAFEDGGLPEVRLECEYKGHVDLPSVIAGRLWFLSDGRTQA